MVDCVHMLHPKKPIIIRLLLVFVAGHCSFSLLLPPTDLSLSFSPPLMSVHLSIHTHADSLDMYGEPNIQ